MSEKYNFIHDLSDEQLEELLCQAVEDEQTDSSVPFARSRAIGDCHCTQHSYP